VVTYYDLNDQHQLDLAGVDRTDEVRVAVETERVNNDLARAVPEDFEKMAAFRPDEAIWVVMTRDDAHRVIAALHDPPEGAPRVGKTYSRNTPPQQFVFDMYGLTEMYTFLYLRDTLLAD